MTAPLRKLPHQSGRTFLTDSGLETTLIFHDGLDLPFFASIVLMRDAAGRARLERYFATHIEIARRHGFGFVMEGPTWRASADWGEKLGIGKAELATLNRDSVALMQAMRDRCGAALPMVVSGNLGPRGDGYSISNQMTAQAAQDYHAPQIETLASAGVDMISAFTMTHDSEAIGIARAASAAGAPAVISFTLETDGRLPNGAPLRDAIAKVDDATDGAVAYYMINCAHPDHFAATLDPRADWTSRIGGIRANASRRSHKELDESSDLDDGNPEELGTQYRELVARLPRLAVLGGCCGTDHRHVECIAAACRNDAARDV